MNWEAKTRKAQAESDKWNRRAFSEMERSRRLLSRGYFDFFLGIIVGLLVGFVAAFVAFTGIGR